MQTNQEINRRRKSIERSLSGYPFPNFDNLIDRANPKFASEYSYALNYANYTFEHSELKDYSQKFADTFGLSLSKVPEWEFYSIGQLAWMHSKDVPLADDMILFLTNKLTSLSKKYNVPVEKPRDAKKERTRFILGELEGVIDDVLLKKENIQQPLALLMSNAGPFDLEFMQNYFQVRLDEVNNEELAESFPDKKRIAGAYTIILKDIEKFKGSKPASGKPRTVRVKKINPTKMVRKLKFLKEVSNLEGTIKSISPEKIIGASVLWVYHVPTRRLGQYIAKTESGLTIKGSTVTDYDEKLSVTKKLRKPEELIPKLMQAGKVEQRKLLDTIKAVASPLNGRINKDTILVRTF